MKFKIGEKVRVKKDLHKIEDFECGYMEEMRKLEGKIVTIKSCSCDGAHIKECPNNYTYNIRAFEKISTKPTKKELLEMPIGTKITTDLEKNNVFTRYSNKYFKNMDCDCLVEGDINEDLTIKAKGYGTKIIKIEQPEYDTFYDGLLEVKEMTVAEIEKALGYPVKIVKEED